MRTIPTFLKTVRRKLISFFRQRYQGGRVYIQKNPFRSVLVVLLVVFILIALGDRLRRPQEDEEVQQQAVKEVEVYRIGSVPTIRVNGKIEKSHVVTLVAQSAGVVQRIAVKPGEKVAAGKQLFSLSTNYQGAVLPSVQRQIASRNYQFQKETIELQKDLIAKNREAAHKTDENADRLREITRESRGVTQDLISVSRESLETVEDLIEYYEQSATPTLTDAQTDENLLLGLRQSRAALLNGLSAAETGLRQLNYNESNDNPPAQLSDLQRDIAQKQLDLQEKTLELNLEIAALNVRVAHIAESLMYPSAPYGGRVERIFVRAGQTVQPGTPLAVLAGDSSAISVIVLVSKEVAQTISSFDKSIIHVGEEEYAIYPSTIAAEPTDGRLFAVTYSLPQIGTAAASVLEKGVMLEQLSSSQNKTAEGEYVTVEIPVGAIETSGAFPFIPIDSVFQSQDGSFIFVEENGEAKSREVTLGLVYGRYVEVREGLGRGEAVLLDRTLIAGDRVRISN